LPCLSLVRSQAPAIESANALTYDELQGLTYLQVKGTGVANTCPVVEAGTTNVRVRGALGCVSSIQPLEVSVSHPVISGPYGTNFETESLPLSAPTFSTTPWTCTVG